MNPSKKNIALIFIPSCFWAYAGSKLLFLSVKSLSSGRFSFFNLACITTLSWVLATIKHHFIFRKTVLNQLHLGQKLLENSISKSRYIKQTFLSKKFLTPLLMMCFSFILRRLLGDSQVFLIIRLTIGYALLKTAFSYSLSFKKLLIGTCEQ